MTGILKQTLSNEDIVLIKQIEELTKKLSTVKNGQKEKVLDIISSMSDDEKVELDKMVKIILDRKPENRLFRLNNDKTYLREFAKTFISIGIYDDLISNNNLINMTSYNHTDYRNIMKKYTQTFKKNPNPDAIKNNESKEEAESMRNYQKNYKKWLGKKLMLGKEDIDYKGVEDIDNIATLYLSDAINHVNTYMNMVGINNDENFKSEFFGVIHSTGREQKTVYEYIQMIANLEKSKKLILERPEYKEKPERFSDAIKNLDMAMFEIQRILGLASLYLDREKNHVYQNIPEDVSFIVSKLLELVADIEDHIDILTDIDDPLYPYTKTKYKYWKKVGNHYDISDVPKKGYKKIKMNSLKLSGKTRDYKNHKVDIDLSHIAIRGKKSGFSSIEKLIRKGFSSFNEILDHKGFIFVVKDWSDGNNLLSLIENKLATLRSSWIEEPIRISQSAGNSFTSSSYDCMKGVIKIPYKGKRIKSLFDLLDHHMNLFNSDTVRKIKQLKKDDVELDSDEDISKFDIYFENIADKNILAAYNEIKTKFKEKSYNLEVEIQIFDEENYLKSEIDESSQAHHNRYRNKQLAANMPIYFPKNIYGETNIYKKIRKLIKDNS